MKSLIERAAEKLSARLKAEGGGCFAYGSVEVQAARYLEARGLARLEDNGPMRDGYGRSDRERWWVTLSERGRL